MGRDYLGLVIALVVCISLVNIPFLAGCQKGFPWDDDRRNKETENHEKVPSEGENDVEKPDDQTDLAAGSFIIFTFDDGHFSDHEVVYPLFEERRIQGVSYINPDFQDREVEGYMSWEQVKELDDAGWDIECHTYSHPDLTDLSEVDILREMHQVDNAFLANGLVPPEHHAYPYGAWNEDVQRIVGEARGTLRTTQEGINTYPFDLSELKSPCLCYEMEVLKGYVDEVVSEGGLLIFYTHDVQENPWNWGIETNKLVEIVDYALDREVEIITLSELMERMGDPLTF